MKFQLYVLRRLTDLADSSTTADTLSLPLFSHSPTESLITYQMKTKRLRYTSVSI